MLRRVTGRTTKAAAKAKGVKRPKINVAVLTSSYEGIKSATSVVDDFVCTPEPWLKRTDKRYTFTEIALKKVNTFTKIRELVSSGKYDVYYNLCDGARDEERAGEDVVRTLEEMNAAYTGASAGAYEVNKVDMKVLLAGAGVKTPNFVVLDTATKSVAKACRHLQFPVIVKHMSGYASVGITKDSKCNNMRELAAQCKKFINEYDHALVEEFIVGKEGTVLVCADANAPQGIKVFPPIMLTFLADPNDFAHFDNKWVKNWQYEKPPIMQHPDPALPQVEAMAKAAFKHVMKGVGYGRVDFRIHEKTGEPYFLEINANCGMLYHPDTGGDYADEMVMQDKEWDHDDWVANAVDIAKKQQSSREPWFCISHDARGHFASRARKNVKAMTPAFSDGEQSPPVVVKALCKVGAKAEGKLVSYGEVGCVVSRGDGIQQMVVMRHSCEPNMTLMHGQTLTLNALRNIKEGEELTFDYSTIRDPEMPGFNCECGAATCRKVISTGAALPRTRMVALPETSNATAAKKTRETRKELRRISGNSRAATTKKSTTIAQPTKSTSTTRSRVTSSSVPANAVRRGGKAKIGA